MTGGNELAVCTIPECLVDGGQVHILEGKGAILTISGNRENNRVNHDQKNNKNRKGTSAIWDFWWFNQFSLILIWPRIGSKASWEKLQNKIILWSLSWLWPFSEFFPAKKCRSWIGMFPAPDFLRDPGHYGPYWGGTESKLVVICTKALYPV